MSRPLTRREAAEYLLEKHGIHHSATTLAKMASQGNGPPYRKIRDKNVIYDPPVLDEYAKAVTSKSAKHSTEHAAAQAAKPDQPKRASVSVLS